MVCCCCGVKSIALTTGWLGQSSEVLASCCIVSFSRLTFRRVLAKIYPLSIYGELRLPLFRPFRPVNAFELARARSLLMTVLLILTFHRPAQVQLLVIQAVTILVVNLDKSFGNAKNLPVHGYGSSFYCADGVPNNSILPHTFPGVPLESNQLFVVFIVNTRTLALS